MKKILLFIFLTLLFRISFANDNNMEIGSHFILTDQNDQLFDSAKVHQKYLLVFFGYTKCPSFCPTAMNDLTSVIKKDHEILKTAQPVFISLDPLVDTPKELKKFGKNFDQNIIFLTSTKKDLEKDENEADKIKSLSNQYKIYVNKNIKNKKETGEQEYEIDHSTFFYLISKNTGKYVSHSASDPESLKILFKEYK